MQNTAGLKETIKRRAGTVLLFSYGLALGTAAPVVLGRCSTSGCGGCAGICGLSLSVLPLLIFLALTGRLKGLGRRLVAGVRRVAATRRVRSA